MQFTDTSENATRWSWDFGDGHPSEEQNPLHEYKNAGRYVVTLTAINECGMSASKTGVVNISCQDVTADFGLEYLAADVATNNLTVRFTDVSQGYGLDIMKWRWDFGDGIKTSWTQATRPVNGQVDHTYPKVAPYTASLEVENECGSVDKVHKLVYNGSHCEDIVANFSPLISSGDAPLIINFIDQTTGEANRWHWDFGDNTFGELQRNATITRGDISHTYEKVGTYVVTLIATGECGKAGVKSGNVDVECDNVSIDFRYQINNPQDEEPLNVTFFITEPNDPDELDKIVKWTWLFDDGTVSHEFNPTHVYPDRLQYDVMVFAENYCGNSGRNQRSIILDCRNLTPWFNVTPQRGIVPLTVYFDENSTPVEHIKAWRWYFGDGGYFYTTDSILPTPESYTYLTPGIFNITLVVQNECTQQFSMNRTVEVFPPYNITAFSNEGGSISPPGITMVAAGDNLIYTITNNTCFDIGDVTVDDTSIGKINAYTFTNIQSDHTINATFVSQGPYSINTSVNIVNPDSTYTPGGGTISPSGNITVPCEWHQQFNITPHTCYDIYDVVIDKDQPNVQHLGPINNYTFVNVQFDQTIDAYFQLKHPQISASANQGGTIDPLGITYLDCGSDQTYTITTESCYNITDVIINGTERLGPQISPFTYTFTNVTTDQAIQAQFALKTFPINATAGEGGVISPTGIIYVLCGYNQVFTITSDNCYEISSVLINEIPLPGPFISPFQYTFPNVLQPQTIDAEFSFKNYNITASSGSNGRIVPSGIISVGCGSDRTLTIVPDSGYVVTDIIVNGESVGSYSSYTLSNIQSDQTIHVDFGLSRNWCPITGNVRTQGGTGTGVPGIRVDVWNQARTILERSGISRADGSYTIMYPRQSGTHRIDLNCPSTTTWTTTSPSGGWVDNAQICNRNGACVALSQNFRGRIIT